MRAFVRGLRPAQWVKNVFVLAPAVFAQELFAAGVVGRAALAFVAFCAASSAVYLLNDLRDREEDRLHPLKRHRPIAAGDLSVPAATTGMIVLAAGALASSLVLGAEVGLILALYLALNTLYSTVLKRVVILDLMAVAIGYVLRVMAGAQAVDVPVSAWLHLCTIFLALFLILSKRRHELVLLEERAGGHRAVLEHYSPAFLDQMINVVTASTVVSYALYAVDDQTVARFGTDRLVYTVPLVVFGIFRYLYLVYQRHEERNPTEAIVRDVPSVVNVVLWAVVVVAMLYGGR